MSGLIKSLHAVLTGQARTLAEFRQLSNLGYTPIDLQDNNLIKAKLKQGRNAALFSFSWTRFDIGSYNHILKITTSCMEPYTAQNLANNGG